MRILVVNPALIRLDALGACEQDRLANIHDLLRLGHDVRLLTRTIDHKSVAETTHYYRDQQIDARVLQPLARRWVPQRLRDIAYLDGAAWTYGAPDFLAALGDWLSDWQPDLVWCHASYLWAPALFARRQGVPAVVRSVNYEPGHFISESGWRKAIGPRYVGKYYGEWRATCATVLAAITPVEQARYHRINRRADVRLLPLRSLPDMLHFTPRAPAQPPLRVFFLGASYNISHNARALEFILTRIVPPVRAQAPGEFEFHLLGSKVPPYLHRLAAPDVVFAGYVPHLADYLANMDIALVPRLAGSGMQQKIFEPLCRGFPTITHRSALAGYQFEDGKHTLLAETATDYVGHLLRLRDGALRQELGQNAQAQARQLFDRAAMDARIQAILSAATGP